MSQTQSTRSTILQLPIMEALREWAIQSVKDKQKGKLMDLLVVIPTIQELKSLSIDIRNISDDDVEHLYRIAQVDVGSLKDQRLQDEQFSFKRNLDDSTRLFIDRMWRKDGDEFEILRTIDKQIVTYSNDSAIKFLDYLRWSGATNLQLAAFEHYKGSQSRAIKEYIKCQGVVRRNKQNFAEKNLIELSSTFKNDLDQSIKEFRDNLMHIDGNSLEKLNKTAKSIQAYSNDSGIKFLDYLRKSGGSSQQLLAFEYYQYQQNQAIEEYIKCQDAVRFNEKYQAEQGLKELSSTFKNKLNRLARRFRGKQMLIDGDQFEKLHQRANLLQDYTKDSGIKFVDYLKSSHAPTQQLSAFEYYSTKQNQTITEFVHYQQGAIINIKQSYATKGHIFWSNKAYMSIEKEGCKKIRSELKKIRSDLKKLKTERERTKTEQESEKKNKKSVLMGSVAMSKKGSFE